jgi:hypothetical protein
MLVRQNSLSMTGDRSLFPQVSFGGENLARGGGVVEEYVQPSPNNPLSEDDLHSHSSALLMLDEAELESMQAGGPEPAELVLSSSGRLRSPSNKLLHNAVENAADVPIATTLLLVLEGIDLYEFCKNKQRELGSSSAGLELALSITRSHLRTKLRSTTTTDAGGGGGEEGSGSSPSAVAAEEPSGSGLSTATMRPPGYFQAFLDADPEFTVALRRIRSGFENISPCGRFVGMEEDLFCTFIAPALTLTRNQIANHKLAAQMNTSMSGYIRWDDFSNFFVKFLHELPTEETGAQVQCATREFHHSLVTKVLFAKKSADGGSANLHMNGYCVTAGYDGAVNLWDTNFYDHVKRVHCLPSAMKNKKWVNDMCFSLSGRLVVAQTRGLAYLYNLGLKCRSSLHRVFRVGNFTEDEAELRLAVEKSRMQGASRASAIDYPAVEMCTLNTPQPGDITCVEGPKSFTFSQRTHMDPLLVGLDNGQVHLYNVYKPVEFRSHVNPLQSLRHFDRGNVSHIVDDVVDNLFLTVGKYANQTYGIEIIDYETFSSSMSLHLRRASFDSTHSLLRCDFDAVSGLIVATGASRTAAIFSSSLPEPICLLSDHSAPIVGSMLNMAKHEIITITKDRNFHIFDVRMLRKLRAVADTSNVFLEHPFSAGAFDGFRGCPVAASCVPVALQESAGPQGTASGVVGSAVGGEAPPKSLLSPGALATEMRATAYNPTYDILFVGEGPHIATRSGRCFQRQDKVYPRTSSVSYIRFDSSGRRLVALDHSCEVSILNAVDGEELCRIDCSASASKPTSASPGAHHHHHHHQQGSRSPTSSSASDEVTCAAFANTDALTQVILLGTAHGELKMYALGDAKELLQRFSISGSVSCLEVCGGSNSSSTKALVGSSTGEILLWDVQTRVHSHVVSFSHVHCGMDLIRPQRAMQLALEASSSSANVSRSNNSNANNTNTLIGGSSSLAAFQVQSQQRMDLALECFIPIDSMHMLALFGTGLAVVLRVGKLDCSVAFTFPCVEFTSSCSSGAYNADSSNDKATLAVGDTDGSIFLFSLRGFIESVRNQSASALPSFFDATKTKAVRAVVHEYVSITSALHVGHSTPISSIFFSKGGLMAVSLFELLAVQIINPAKGTLVFSLCSYRLPGVCGIRTLAEDHPFFTLLSKEYLMSASADSREPFSVPSLHTGLELSKLSLATYPNNLTTAPITLISLSQNLDCSKNSKTDNDDHFKSPTEKTPREVAHQPSYVSHGSLFGNTHVPVKMEKPKFKMPGRPHELARPQTGSSYSSIPRIPIPDYQQGSSASQVVSSSALRPVSARQEHDALVASRLYPSPRAPASARTYRPPPSAGRVLEEKSSITYSHIPPSTEFVTSELARLHPPMYTVTPPLPPQTPTFASAQPPSPEHSRETEQRIISAVNTATNITSRIEKNIKMLRLARAGVRTGNVFQLLEQLPLDKKAFTTKPGAGRRKKGVEPKPEKHVS